MPEACASLSEIGRRAHADHRSREGVRSRRGVGTVVREPDRHEVVVRSAGLALGVDSLNEGDRVSFDIDTGTDWQVAPRGAA